MLRRLHSAARRTGTCKNAASVRRSHLENAVLGVLKDNLLQPDLVEEFVRSYHAEINRNAAEASAQSDRSTKKLTKIEKQIEAIIDSIANGFRSDALKERLEQLEAERKALGRDLSQTKPSPIRLHPKLPAIYRAKVEKLTEALTDPAIRDEAAEAIRGLIDAVAVEMTEVGPEVEVRGEISKMIGFSDPKIEQNQCSVKVVAGLGFEPRTFRL